MYCFLNRLTQFRHFFACGGSGLLSDSPAAGILLLRGKILPAFITAALVITALTACKKQPSQPTGPPEKITFAYTTIPHSVLFHIAFVKGLFSAEGLEVTPQPHEFGQVALNSLLEGKADFATVADTPIMFTIAGGTKISVIAVIMASNKSVAIVARKDRGIGAPSDLRGKTIGVTLGTSGDFFLDSFLVTRGIGRQEVNIIDMKPNEMRDALIKGKVDAVSTWYPTLAHLRNGLGEKGLIFYDEDVHTGIFCVTAWQEFAKKHPEAIKKVLKALVKAETFVKQDPEESRRLVAEFIKTDKSLLGEIWDFYDFRVGLEQSLLASLEEQGRWAIKNRLVSGTNIPNYLDFIYLDGLRSVKPEAVRIIR